MQYVLALSTFMIAVLTGCVVPNPNPNPTPTPTPTQTPPPTSNMTTCSGDMKVVNSSAPYGVYAWLNDGITDGANHFFVWELTKAADGSFKYKNGAAYQNAVKTTNWVMPPSVWGAGRIGTDGYDNVIFDLNNMFVLGYLPPSPGHAQWTSTKGTTYHKNCPGEPQMIGDRVRCLGLDGKSELDPLSPWNSATHMPLTVGSWYSARFLFALAFSNANGTATMSYIGRCYEKVFQYCPNGVHTGGCP